MFYTKIRKFSFSVNFVCLKLRNVFNDLDEYYDIFEGVSRKCEAEKTSASSDREVECEGAGANCEILKANIDFPTQFVAALARYEILLVYRLIDP